MPDKWFFCARTTGEARGKGIAAEIARKPLTPAKLVILRWECHLQGIHATCLRKPKGYRVIDLRGGQRLIDSKVSETQEGGSRVYLNPKPQAATHQI
jgi:hypothetical protein